MSNKKALAKSALSPELHSSFEALVEDYKKSAEAHVGRVWVNYNILADLVNLGWRKVS